MISIAMGIYLLFSFFLNMCFAYSKFFIIFEGMKAIESLSASTWLAVRHINITGKLYFTMILLYLRTILVAAIFLVIPFAISAIITFFTIITVKIIFLRQKHAIIIERVIRFILNFWSRMNKNKNLINGGKKKIPSIYFLKKNNLSLSVFQYVIQLTDRQLS